MNNTTLSANITTGSYVQHVTTSSMEATVSFYTNVLGMQVIQTSNTFSILESNMSNNNAATPSNHLVFIATTQSLSAVLGLSSMQNNLQQ